MTSPMRSNHMNASRGRTLRKGLMLSLALALYAGDPVAQAIDEPQAQSSDGLGGSLLIAAVKEKQWATLQRLIKDGADINSSVTGEGTALIVACRQGNLDIVNELLRLGADVNRSSRGDGSPLIAASINGKLSLVQRLLAAGAQVDAVVTTDETALINAVRAGRLEVVKYLVEHGADVKLGVVADNGQWRSPLNQARDSGIKDYLVSKGAVR